VSSQQVELKEVGFVSEAGVGMLKNDDAKEPMIMRAIAETTIATGLLVTFNFGRIA
jgi:hypothetical protein